MPMCDMLLLKCAVVHAGIQCCIHLSLKYYGDCANVGT